MDGSRPVLKARIQRILRQIGIYDRLRESFAYDCYRRWRYGRPIRWRHNELLFYRSLLGGRSGGMLVFDVGAHRGQRTDVFLQLGARVIAIEPDASNQRLLARRYRGNRSRGNPVTVVGKAVSDASAAATLWVHAPGSGLNSLSQKWVRELGKDDRRFGSKVEFAGRQQVETTTLETLMNSFGVPCYIKIDVEGHEPSVLRGLKRPVPFLSFEVNLPEFLPEGLECIEILDRLAGDGRFNWSRDCQGGLALREWLAGAEFASSLRGCAEASVEVFWRTSPDPTAADRPPVDDGKAT
jgi:FkbM family methyltransferase